MDSRDRLLKPGEVADLFRVDPKTVTRWAAEGKLNSIRTPGRHRRFPESAVRALLARSGGTPEALDKPAHQDEEGRPVGNDSDPTT